MSAWRVLQVVIVIGIFAAVFWRLDWSAMLDQIRDVELWRIVVVIALNLPVALLYATRSYFVLGKLGHRMEPSLLVPIAVLGNVAGSYTPASAGEILRGQALSGHANVPAGDSFALVLFERGLSLYMLLLGGLAALAVTTLPAWAGALIFAACLAGLAAPPVGARILDAMSRSRYAANARPSSFVARIFSVADRLALICGDIRVLIPWISQTVVMFAISTLQFWILAAGVSDEISFLDAWIAFSIPTLIGVLSLIPLGLGAFDGSVAAVFDRLGATFEQGSAIAVLVRATISVPLLLLAFVSYLYLMRRRAADEASLSIDARPAA